MLVCTLTSFDLGAQNPCVGGQADIIANFNGFFNSNRNDVLIGTVGQEIELCLTKTAPDSRIRIVNISNIQSEGQEVLATYEVYTSLPAPFNFGEGEISTALNPIPVNILKGSYGIRVSLVGAGSFDVTTLVQSGNSTRTRSFSVQIQAQVAAPVTWTKDLTFEGYGENVRFNWSVADQVDVSGYELERMFVNGTFEKVADVPYQENGSLEVNYTAEVSWPAQGAYYRVKQLDYAGTYDYSNVVFVEANDGIQQGFRMFPNPASRTVQLVLPAGVQQVDLISASGQTIQSLTPDEARRGIDVSNVTSGMYLVRPIMSDGPAAPHRLMVNR